MNSLKKFDNFAKTPDGYQSFFTTEQKLQASNFAAEFIDEKFPEGTVILSGIYGSALAGADHKNSDFDIAVVTLDEPSYNKKFSVKAEDTPFGVDCEISVIPMKKFPVEILDTHIGYALISSKFSIVHPQWESYFSCMRINPFLFEFRSMSLAASIFLAPRQNKSVEKMWKQIVQIYSLCNSDIYLERDMLNIHNEQSREILEWAKDSIEKRIHLGKIPHSGSKAYSQNLIERIHNNYEALYNYAH